MVAILLIDALLIAAIFFISWKYFGGRNLYRNLTRDETLELEQKIDELDLRIAELPAADGAGVTSPAVEFLRGELERDRRRTQAQLRQVRRSHNPESE